MVNLLPIPARTIAANSSNTSVSCGGETLSLSWSKKDSSAVLDYWLDVTSILNQSSDQLENFEITIGYTDENLTLIQSLQSGNFLGIFVGGGTPGFTYAIRFTLYTVAGRTFICDVALPMTYAPASGPFEFYPIYSLNFSLSRNSMYL